MRRLINVYRCKFRRKDWPNVGDLVSSPFKYYADLGTPDEWDIQEDSLPGIPENAIVIFGGGGLFYFKEQISEFLRMKGSRRAIGWGIGHNFHDQTNVN